VHKIGSPDSLYRVQVIRRGLTTAKDAGNSAVLREVIADTLSNHTGHPHGVCSHVDEWKSEVERGKTIMSSIVDLTTSEIPRGSGKSLWERLQAAAMAALRRTEWAISARSRRLRFGGRVGGYHCRLTVPTR